VGLTFRDAAARTLAPLHIVALRRAGVELGEDLVILGRPIVARASSSRISIGDRVALVSRPEDTALGVGRPVILRTLAAGAVIEIGSDAGLSGTAICAAFAVKIGARVLVGADVVIADTDFHEIETVNRRHAPMPRPGEDDAVVVGDDVFIGTRAIILKGSRIGRGTVIGAGSVVTGSLPAGVVAAGNPCRPLRPLLAPGEREE
jgi:acetyltransferase-like isoleucine patch superfamily enzyme